MELHIGLHGSRTTHADGVGAGVGAGVGEVLGAGVGAGVADGVGPHSPHNKGHSDRISAPTCTSEQRSSVDGQKAALVHGVGTGVGAGDGSGGAGVGAGVGEFV